jgi:hypothetical protein
LGKAITGAAIGVIIMAFVAGIAVAVGGGWLMSHIILCWK